jgi:hypothetical protein
VPMWAAVSPRLTFSTVRQAVSNARRPQIIQKLLFT